MYLVTAACLFLFAGACAAQPAVDFDLVPAYAKLAGFDASNVTYTYTPTFSTPGGVVSFRTLAADPFLGTLPKPTIGSGYAVLNPCGVVLPHVHPRATEMLIMVKGELSVGFVEEAPGTRLIADSVTKGQGFVFPQGLLHFQYNKSCKKVEYVVTFPDADPGTQLAANSLLTMPNGVLRAVLGVKNLEVLKGIKESVSKIPIPAQDPACLERCGLA